MAHTESLEPTAKAIIAQEIAGILSEHGRFREARALYEEIQTLFPSGLSSMSQTRYAAFVRRRANSLIAERGLTPDADSLLSDAVQAIPGDANIRAGSSNSRAWAYLSERKYGVAMEVLAPLYDKYEKLIFKTEQEPTPINISAWNAAEIFHSYAVAAYHLRENSKGSIAALKKASNLYGLYQMKTFTLREGFWDQESALHRMIATQGLAEIPMMSALPADIFQDILHLGRLLTT
jgi:hypothetical protein